MAMSGYFAVLSAAILFDLLEPSFGQSTKVFNCPCTFSVVRHVDLASNHETFDVLVENAHPHSIRHLRRNIGSRSHSLKKISVSDATHSDSNKHYFEKMVVDEKGFFRVSVRHHSSNPDREAPFYNLDLQTSEKQVVCPIVLAPDLPIDAEPEVPEIPLEGRFSVSSKQAVDRMSRMGAEQDPRIVGGLLASDTLVPYLAAFEIPTLCENGTPGCVGSCTGTVISGKWILTAAHCRVTNETSVFIASRTNPSVGPIEGSFPTRMVAEGAFSVAQVVAHPLYTSLPEAERYQYDIAVVELEEDITDCCTTAPQFMPVALRRNAAKISSFARAAGYGILSEDRSVPEPEVSQLRQVDVPIISNRACDAAYDDRIINRTRQICAGYYRDGGCDTCQGDSGGPLIQYSGTQPVLIGLTAFGNGCAAPGFPGVYVRLSGHKAWLKSTGAVLTAHSGRVNQIRRRCKKGEYLPYVAGEVSECTACEDDEFSSGRIARVCSKCPVTLLRDTKRGDRCSCRRRGGFGWIGTECRECAPGRFSRIGANRCGRCRPGTFAPDSGSTECLPCTGAPRGASECAVLMASTEPEEAAAEDIGIPLLT